jgi:glycosyltransferase involved in cell wall biosynthesis
MSKLSIIVTVYNIQHLISRCLDSIFDQNIDKNLFEVIAVNDGSTDESLNILNNYLTHKNFRIINQRNSGVGAAKNKGLLSAIGDYVWFVDGDDFISNNSLNYVLREININYDVIFIGYNIISNSTISNKHLFDPNKLSCGIDFLIQYGSIPSWSVVISKTLLNDNHLTYQTTKRNSHEDCELNFKAVSIAKKINSIQQYIYNYIDDRNDSLINNPKLNSPLSYAEIVKGLHYYMINLQLTKYDKIKFYKAVNIILMMSIENSCFSNSKQFNEYIDFIKQNRNIVFKSLKYLNFKYKLFYLILQIDIKFGIKVFRLFSKIKKILNDT